MSNFLVSLVENEEGKREDSPQRKQAQNIGIVDIMMPRQTRDYKKQSAEKSSCNTKLTRNCLWYSRG